MNYIDFNALIVLYFQIFNNLSSPPKIIYFKLLEIAPVKLIFSYEQQSSLNEYLAWIIFYNFDLLTFNPNVILLSWVNLFYGSSD